MLNRFTNRIKRYLSKPVFNTKDVQIGQGVHFGRNVVFNCAKVRIGDGCIIKDNVIVDATEFSLGDYGTIYQNCFFPGPGKINIGHNFWMGMSALMDAQGDTVIGNNVCVGPQSQLWGHIRFGDVLYGCQFNETKKLSVGNDVWLGGQTLVAPVHIADRAMVLMGSKVTKDLAMDHTYAGGPAVQVTDKVGPQFKISTVAERREYLEKAIQLFCQQNNIDFKAHFLILDEAKNMDSTKTNFILFDRTYTKRAGKMEMALIRHLLPEAKFTPR